MATYKVLQDIEAEDTLIGPLTPRQCIYAAIAIVAMYLSYLVYAQGAAFLIVFLLPFIGFGIFFAFPWRKEQSTEVWALARVRFALKPRRRIWDQTGTKNLVTVTAPIVTDPRVRTMSETEVVSRLHALANTIDSRGWATKNVPATMYAAQAISASDRLTGASMITGATPGPGMYDSTDIFDVAANPLAGELDAKMAASAGAKRQQLENNMNGQPSQPAVTPMPAAPTQAGQATQAVQPQQAWYTPTPQQAPPQPQAQQQPIAAFQQAQNVQSAQQPVQAMQNPAFAQPAAPANVQPAAQPVSQQTAQQPQPPVRTFTAAPVAQDPTAEEEAFIQQRLQQAQPANNQQVTQQPAAYGDVRTVQAPTMPIAAAPQPIPMPQPPAAVTPPVNPAILELANNNDLNIATIAREAQQINQTHPAGTLGVNQSPSVSPVQNVSNGQQNGEVTVPLR